MGAGRHRRPAAVLLLAVADRAAAAPIIDRTQLEVWAGGYYGQAVAERRTPGVTISLIQDGQLLFAKGYGYADSGKMRPADPASSGFIVGSVTKTFIATARARGCRIADVLVA